MVLSIPRRTWFVVAVLTLYVMISSTPWRMGSFAVVAEQSTTGSEMALHLPVVVKSGTGTPTTVSSPTPHDAGSATPTPTQPGPFAPASPTASPSATATTVVPPTNTVPPSETPTYAPTPNPSVTHAATAPSSPSPGVTPAASATLAATATSTPAGQPATPTATATPLAFATPAHFAAGGFHTCMVTDDTGVACWGFAEFGQTGDGSQGAGAPPQRNTPVRVLTQDAPLTGVVSIAAGHEHTCAVTAAAQVRCWGNNAYGQLGFTTTQTCSEVDCSTVAQSVLGADGAPMNAITALTAGNAHTCALRASGDVWCWGRNDTGQLGDNGVADGKQPIRVSGLPTGIVAITAGSGNPLGHTCALSDGGEVWCWGNNQFGQLGDGTTEARSLPVSVHSQPGVSLTGVRGIAAGSHIASGHTCALLSHGEVRCWGRGDNGQLGDGGSSVSNPYPVTVLDGNAPLGAAVAIAAGYQHTCALRASGAVYCWGLNSNGQLGNGSITDTNTATPVVGLVGPAVALAAGDAHTCARLHDGRIQCWGSNQAGQLGKPGAGIESPIPVEVAWP